jgi:hypothetical protein
MKTPDRSGGGKVRPDLAQRPSRTDLIGQNRVTLFCTNQIDKGQLRLCWWTEVIDRKALRTPRSKSRPAC